LASRYQPIEGRASSVSLALVAAKRAPTYDQTDWRQIVTLYDGLLEVWPSPVVALNRAVAVAMVSGPSVALAEVQELEEDGRLAGWDSPSGTTVGTERAEGVHGDRPAPLARGDRRPRQPVERPAAVVRLSECGFGAKSSGV